MNRQMKSGKSITIICVLLGVRMSLLDGFVAGTSVPVG